MTKAYYQSLGFPQMANNDHHHSLDDVDGYETLYQPRKSLLNKLLRKKYIALMWLKFNK